MHSAARPAVRLLAPVHPASTAATSTRTSTTPAAAWRAAAGSLRPGQVAGAQDDGERPGARARTWVRCRPWLSSTAKTTAIPSQVYSTRRSGQRKSHSLRGTDGERQVDDRDDAEPAELAGALAQHAVPQPRQQREHQPGEVRRGHAHRTGDRLDRRGRTSASSGPAGPRSPGRSLPLFSIRAPCCERTARSAVSTSGRKTSGRKAAMHSPISTSRTTPPRVRAGPAPSITSAERRRRPRRACRRGCPG